MRPAARSVSSLYWQMPSSSQWISTVPPRRATSVMLRIRKAECMAFTPCRLQVKVLKPVMPSFHMASSSSTLSGEMPPFRPKSTQDFWFR